jgi:uncharacterized surface protein with fasciclin (FAS1) repeats
VVTVNGAKVEKADIEASNGVIHILEAPLLTIPTEPLGTFLASDPM